VTPDNICAIVAITEQESGFRADPAIPNLPSIAWAEIERRREKVGVPKFALDAALSIKSTNGRTYRERIDAARTERDLSETFEDMIGRVPLGRTFFEDNSNGLDYVSMVRTTFAVADQIFASGFDN